MTVKKLIAALLALALITVMPAMGEDNAPELNAGVDITLAQADSIDLDAAPELSGDLEIDSGINAGLTVDGEPAAAGSDGTADNDSKPAPDYRGKDFMLTVDRDLEQTVMIGDNLYLMVVEAVIQSVASDNERVAYVSGSASKAILIFANSVGTANITVTLEDGTSYNVALTVEDRVPPEGMSLSEKSVTLLTGQDIDLTTYIVLKPTYAKPSFTYKSSDGAVVKVNRQGIARALKPGRATVTITTQNGLKKSMKVAVKANRTGVLHAKPTSKITETLGKMWTLWPKSLEIRGDGSLVCNLWLVNGAAGRLNTLKNLDLAVSLQDGNGDTLIARAQFKKTKVDCGKERWQTVTLTFPKKATYCGYMDLTGLDVNKLGFRLYEMPVAVYGKKGSRAYVNTGIPVDGEANPVKYRALLVSENDFYWENATNPDRRWEHSTRNRGDVMLMQEVLKRVRTPDGSRYSVTVQHNTSLREFKQLVKNTFADADGNDVSLLFFASHGDSDDSSSKEDAGALSMASQGEHKPEELRLSELRDLLLDVPGKVIVILGSCGSGAAVYANNGAVSDGQRLARAAEAHNARVVDVFRSADPGVVDATYAANTGELRRANKFYVLTAAAYREESWGTEDITPGTEYGNNYFALWLAEGVGKSGDMPADSRYAGNKNGMVDLHELYRYIAGVGDHFPVDDGTYFYHQHVQVYPSDVRYTMFK